MWWQGRPRRFRLRLPRRGLCLLLLLFRWSSLAARGGLWKLVIVVMALEAFACLKLTLTLPSGLAEQWGDLLFGLIVTVALIPPGIALGGRRLAHVLDGRARVLVVRRWEPSFHHLE